MPSSSALPTQPAPRAADGVSQPAAQSYESTMMLTSDKKRAPTLRPLYNDTDSDIEWKLTEWVTEPILHYCIPRWVKPNHITFFNTSVCWTLLATSYLAWRLEATQPEVTLALRFLCAVFVFVSMLCDCLDGMQARRTHQSSLLGELLDHGADAAHTCIFAAVMLTILQPDFFTACYSLVCTGMVYNAQLVLYRHRGRMVNPPTNGPEAQLALITAIIAFSVFIFVSPRHTQTAQSIILLFSIGANIAQINNIRFFYQKLRENFPVGFWTGPHIRYAVTVAILAVMGALGWLSVPLYWLCFITLSYRWNTHYLLYTLLNKYNPTPQVKQLYHNTEVNFQWDSLGWLAALGLVNGLLLHSPAGGWKTAVMPLTLAAYLLASTIGELLYARVELNAVQQRMRKAEASKANDGRKQVN